jgi:lipopolysaccharide cholinephosphotransferase
MATVHDMKAILGEDFFKEEVRCDYLVSAKMKRIWAVLLDMYLSFAEVCDKYGLKYFVVGGTLLGAIRHKGFIPWDDDFDVGMLREDYEEFLNIATSEIHFPLFFQTPYTDPGYFVSWVKIRNSTTTGISKITNHRRFNQGLFLDIFPMDYFSLDTMEENRSKIYECAKKCGAYMREGSKHLNERQKKDAITYYSDNPMREWNTLQRIASNVDNKGSEYIGNAVFTGYSLDKVVYPASGFDDIISHPFEGIEVPVPCGWEDQLRIQFGNYLEYPPLKDRGVRHSDVIFDADRPYTDYLL